MNDPKTKDAPAFDFYPERWIAGTMHLSPLERGAYINLLCHQWLHGRIPGDAQALVRICGCRPPQSIMDKFPDGVNAMLENVRGEQRKRIAKSRAKIEKMNAARASCRASTRESKTPLQEPLQGPPHHSPLTTHHRITESEPTSVTEWGPEKQPIGCGSDSVSIPPVTVEVAKQAAPAMGVSTEAAESWWLDHDARGWLDGRGQPVRNWRSSLTAYGRRWQSNEARRPSLPDPAKTHGKQPLPLF